MKNSPALRLTLGLVLLTTCLLFVAQQLGLMPSEARAHASARAKIAESLALQIAAAADVDELRIISTTLDTLTQRTPDILSAGLRESDGTLLVEAGEHQTRWPESAEDRAPGTHAAIPIFKNGSPWATLELRFTPFESVGAIVPWAGPHLSLIVFIALTSFLVYFLFLRRTLRYLDPSSVVPARVKAAMDAMTEGVLILDNDSNIVLANAAFANKVGASLASLIGRNPAELGWTSASIAEENSPEFPWDDAKTQRETQLAVPLSLTTKSKGIRTFTVNAAPIMDSGEKYRGTLVTFDDVTEVEENNAQLRRMLCLIETSQKKVKRQNKKLQFLATRDALTGCLNRRSFYPQLEEILDSVRDQDGELVCIMVDIDHFKSVNDRFGHAAGDKVIKSVAQVFLDTLRGDELVCRYGGEEFCIALPGAGIEQGFTIAERLRETIESRELMEVKGGAAPRVTASFGVSSMTSDSFDLSTLIENADKALYAAKRGGRNRVVRFTDCDSITNTEGDQSEKVAYRQDVGETPAVVLSAGQHNVPSTSENNPGVVNRLKGFIKRLQHTVAQRTEELAHQKTHDELTGLPNRVLLWDRIGQAVARAKRQDKPFALIVLNINRFRRVNEWLGYSGGDQLLKEVGERLMKVLRATDSVARLDSSPTVSRRNADDFALLLTDLDKIESIAVVAERIIECFTHPMEIDGREIYVTASMGISSYPSDGESPEELLTKADRAMGNDKLHAGNSYQFYSEYMDSATVENLRLENDLRRAIADGGLCLHYQPQVELETGRVTCMEALLRWEHPELGMIPPNEFIPVAEYTGLINPIGGWVLRQACEQARLWQESGAPDIRVAVNVSPIQLKQKTFLRQVTTTLKETGLKPNQLELEVTESSVMEDLGAAIFILRKLRELGVHTAIDDFGIGYSSLSYIKRFPATTVKIDQSFVRDLDADVSSIVIVSAIIKMAHELKLTVVAEGVETPEHAAQLRDARCDLIQGYLFSRPVPADQTSELILSNARSKPWWPTGPRAIAPRRPA